MTLLLSHPAYNTVIPESKISELVELHLFRDLSSGVAPFRCIYALLLFSSKSRDKRVSGKDIRRNIKELWMDDDNLWHGRGRLYVLCLPRPFPRWQRQRPQPPSARLRRVLFLVRLLGFSLQSSGFPFTCLLLYTIKLSFPGLHAVSGREESLLRRCTFQVHIRRFSFFLKPSLFPKRRDKRVSG